MQKYLSALRQKTDLLVKIDRNSLMLTKFKLVFIVSI